MRTKRNQLARVATVAFAALLYQFLGDAALGQSEAEVIAAIGKIRGAHLSKDSEGHVTRVDLSFSTESEVASIEFGVLAHLHTLSTTGATNKSLANLRKIPAGQLKILRITDSRIDDSELVPLLQKQKSLRWLMVKRTPVGDGTLLEAGNLEGLTILDLANTGVTDAGLKNIKNAKKLSYLNLSHTVVSDAGIREIKSLSRLGILFLGSTKITDAGLEAIVDIQFLTHIDVSNTKITDAGILKLGGMGLLTRLNVSRTKVTEDGKRTLQEAHPKLEFEK